MSYKSTNVELCVIFIKIGSIQICEFYLFVQSSATNPIYHTFFMEPIPADIFYKHLEKLYLLWQKNGDYDFDSIILINGKGNLPGNEKTIAVISWLFVGYNLSDIIFALSKTSIYIYASDKKISFLKNLKEDNQVKRFNLTFIAKVDQPAQTFRTLWNNLHKNNGSHQPKVGFITSDKHTGPIPEQFDRIISAKKHEKLDLMNFFNDCFMLKQNFELEYLKKSGIVCVYFFNKLIKEMETVIDSNIHMKHSEIANKINEMMENEAQIKKCVVKHSDYKIQKNYIDFGAPCYIQSGGKYSNKIFSQSNDEILKGDYITIGLGALYKCYNSYIARTFLINPNEQEKSIYKKIETLYKVITQNLRPKVKISDVYKAARQYIADNLSFLEVPKHFGFGIGAFLNESNLTINQTNDRIIVPGYSFLVICNFPSIKLSSKKGNKRQFPIQIADTIIITDKNDILTADIAKTLNQISYSLQDDIEKQPKPTKIEATVQMAEGRRRKVHQQTSNKLKNQKQRKEHQEKIKNRKLLQLEERINQNFQQDFKQQKVIDVSRAQSYKVKQQMPKDLQASLIYIDEKRRTVILPIGDKMVPLHIYLIKSVVKNDEGKQSSLRFNLHYPNNVLTIHFPTFSQPTVYIRQLVFRSKNNSKIAELQKQIKALQKKARLQLIQKSDKDDIVQLEKISLNRGKRPVLRDLLIRPYNGLKKTKGVLECHLNGFKYVQINLSQPIQIPFSNIKNAFFQPCQKQIIAAIHFKLKDPILIGKKKTEDVQFYSEGGIVSEDIGRGKGEDSDDEQQQKEIKRRIDKDFSSWTSSCSEYIKRQFSFQIPKREMGFYGTTEKVRTNILLQPTESCLVNVTESPPFIICLEDIEVAWFERMTGNVRYFDLTIVNKDYEQHVRINSISIKDVQTIKDWLDSNNIIFYDNKISVNWNKFLQGVRSDFKKFVKDGAWTAWDKQDSQDNISGDESDSEFNVEKEQLSQESSQSQESDSGYEQQKESDDEKSQNDSSQLTQKGLSWDEMQEKAQRQDKEKLRREMLTQKETIRPSQMKKVVRPSKRR